MPSLQKIKAALGRSDKDFLVADETIQDRLRGPLRQKAIEHLRTAATPVAEGFRSQYLYGGQYLHGNPPHVNTFLDRQSQNGTWGTYIEAAALGEALGCHVVVTDISKGIRRKPYCIYNAGDNDAEIIHLTLEDNRHWSINESTKGGGNCLYNAFSQALRGLFVAAQREKQPDTQRLSHEVAEVKAQREALLAVVKTQPTPEEHKEELALEKARIHSLPPEERVQIEEDHKFALELALKELEPSSSTKDPSKTTYRGPK